MQNVKIYETQMRCFITDIFARIDPKPALIIIIDDPN